MKFCFGIFWYFFLLIFTNKFEVKFSRLRNWKCFIGTAQISCILLEQTLAWLECFVPSSEHNILCLLWNTQNSPFVVFYDYDHQCYCHMEWPSWVLRSICSSVGKKYIWEHMCFVSSLEIPTINTPPLKSNNVDLQAISLTWFGKNFLGQLPPV